MFRVKCLICNNMMRFSDFEVHAYQHYVQKHNEKTFRVKCKICRCNFPDMLTYTDHFRQPTHAGKQPDVKYLEIIPETRPLTTINFKRFVDEHYVPCGNRGERLVEDHGRPRTPGYGTPAVYDDDGTIGNSGSPAYVPKTPDPYAPRTSHGYGNADRTPNPYGQQENGDRTPNPYGNQENGDRTPNPYGHHENGSQTPNQHGNKENASRTPNHTGGSRIGTPGYRPQSNRSSSSSSSANNPPKTKPSRNSGRKPSTSDDQYDGSKSPGYPRGEGVKYTPSNLNDLRFSGSRSPGFPTGDEEERRHLEAQRESVRIESRSTAKAMPSRNRQATLQEPNNPPVSRREAHERRERRQSSMHEKLVGEMSKTSNHEMGRGQHQPQPQQQQQDFQPNFNRPPPGYPIPNSHVNSQPPPPPPPHFQYHHFAPQPVPPPFPSNSSTHQFPTPPPQQFQHNFSQVPPPLPRGPPPPSHHRGPVTPPTSPTPPPPPPPPPQQPSTSQGSSGPSWMDEDRHMDMKPNRADLDKDMEREKQRLSRGVRRTGEVERREPGPSQERPHDESFGRKRGREKEEDRRSYKKSSSSQLTERKQIKTERTQSRRRDGSYDKSDSD